MPLPPLPQHCGPVDMSEPSAHELVAQALRTFGEVAARELAKHLDVPFEDCLSGQLHR